MEIYPEFADQVAFYLVGQDPTETLEDLERTREERGYPWPVVKPIGQMMRDLRVVKESTKIMFDGRGIMVYRNGGGGDSRAWARVFHNLADGSTTPTVTTQSPTVATQSSTVPAETSQSRVFIEGDSLETMLALLPEARAPMKLRRLSLPTDVEGVIRLMDRLPPSVEGVARSVEIDRAPRRFLLYYGKDQPGLDNPSMVMALDIVGSGEEVPVGPVGEFLISLAPGGGWEVLEAAREDKLIWVKWSTTFTGGTQGSHPIPVYTLMWADYSSNWVFGVSGDSLGRLDPLLVAFAGAAIEAGR